METARKSLGKTIAKAKNEKWNSLEKLKQKDLFKGKYHVQIKDISLLLICFVR